ncbi:MAG: PEP-CTERM sorting domain-containing protein [Oscillatoriales cyanobacterium RM2_1_1]|nr:PEP-CTERM sorting domain-containing protein [Oscillatoriales cyanobacterium RM2_1_1]
MKPFNAKKLAGVLVAAICVFSSFGQAANAADFKTVGSQWNIVLDSFKDGTDGVGVGSASAYEIFGIAMKQEQNRISVAINANIPLLGNSNAHAADGNIGWGDLFFNFSGKNFKDAGAAGELFGVRFAGTNDSGAANLGVYGNVQAKSVSQDNSGWGSFSSYQSWVESNNRDKTPGATGTKQGAVGFGDLNATEARQYLTEETVAKQVKKTIRVPKTYTVRVRKNGVLVKEERTRMVSETVYETVYEKKINDSNYSIQNVIASGDFLGKIGMLSAADLQGLDFGTGNKSLFGTAQTFGFSFDKALLPDGDALVSLLAECANDGVVMAANLQTQAVPEPASILGLTVLGVTFVGGKLRRRSNP